MYQQSIETLKKIEGRWLKSFYTVQVITNQYQTRLSNLLKYFRIFQIHTQPQVEKDSHRIFFQANRSMPESIRKSMDCSFFARRGYSMWCMAKIELTPDQQKQLKAVPPSYEIQVQEQKYKILLKYVKQSQLSKKQNMQLITQHLNVRLRHLILKNCKMKQIVPNVFFPKWSIQEEDFQLQIQARIGFKYTLSYLQLLFCDVNNEIKVINNKSFLETIKEKNMNPIHYKGQRVMKTYGKQVTFIISDVDFNQTPLSKFTRNGKQITYVEYYKTCYQIEIKNMKQPLIVAFSPKSQMRLKRGGTQLQTFQQKIYLIPELVCLMLSTKDISPKFLKKLNMTPNKCIQVASDFIKDVNKGQDEFLIHCQNRRGVAHLLPSPEVEINSFTTKIPKQGGFKIQEQVLEPLQMKDVLIVYSIGNNKKYDRDQIDHIIQTLNKAGQRYKIKIQQKFELQIEDSSTPQQWIREIQKDTQKNGKPTFIIFMFLKKQTVHYQYFKRELTYKLQISSQVLLREKFAPGEKGVLKIAANIIKQIAAKLNRSLWKIKSIRGFEQKLPLIIGLSVQRQGPKFQLVMCRNTNKDNSKFKVQTFLISSKEIPTKILQQKLYQCIKDYIKAENKKFRPSTILIYRLGVNNQTKQQEILINQTKIIKDTIKSIAQRKFQSSKFDPEIIYIHVVDRPSQKFWIQDGQNQPGSYLPRVVNPDVGTVMRGSDDNQFVLVPYKARQGTVQPSLYRVIMNQKKVPMDFIVQFTYAQCYMYFNWQGSVRVPEVLQYCKKVHYFVKPDKQYNQFTFQALSFI